MRACESRLLPISIRNNSSAVSNIIKYFIARRSHAVFLIVHPYTPLAKYETLFDWVVYGGLPEERSDSLTTWTGKVLAYCAAHFCLSSQGMIAATLAFKYQVGGSVSRNQRSVQVDN